MQVGYIFNWREVSMWLLSLRVWMRRSEQVPLPKRNNLRKGRWTMQILLSCRVLLYHQRWWHRDIPLLCWWRVQVIRNAYLREMPYRTLLSLQDQSSCCLRPGYLPKSRRLNLLPILFSWVLQCFWAKRMHNLPIRTFLRLAFTPSSVMSAWHIFK
jgi:hypothetical protein